MMALDTNVLIRFLVRDDASQAETVKGRFKEAEEKGEVLLVPLLVVLETIWVLESAYNASKKEIAETLVDLLKMPILSFEAREVVQAAASSASGPSSMDLSDLLIGYAARNARCDAVLTFDKRAAASPLFELLENG
jgi:predicted nucleic-acid-binding protein